MPIFKMKPARQDRDSGALILECHAAIKFIAVVLGIMGVVVLPAVMFVHGFREPQEPLIAFGLAGSFAGMGLVLYVVSQRVIVLTSEDVASFSPWSESRSMKWDEISKVTFSDGPQWFVLHSPSGKTIRVHLALHGIGDFARMVREFAEPGKISASADRALTHVTQHWGSSGR